MAEEVDYEAEVDNSTSSNTQKTLKIKMKGRGHQKRDQDDESRNANRGGNYDSVQQQHKSGPAKSVEGWIIIVTNVHEEALEDDILDKFSDHGEVKNIHVNLDRRSGFVKGYALLEFETKREAAEAIEKMNGVQFLGQTITVDWAFVAKYRSSLIIIDSF